MTTAPALAVGLYGLIATLIILILRFVGLHNRILTPIGLFVAIEITAVWPPLIPTESTALANIGSYPAILAGVGLLATVVVYVLMGGASANVARWRDGAQMPSAELRRSITTGLVVLVATLVLLGLVEFRGLPPLLTGGIGSLLDPLGNADQVAVIRETRRSLTKGHTLLGEAYAGQGFINTSTRVGWRVSVAVALLLWSWKRTRRSLQVVVLVVTAAFIFLGSAGSRSPLLLCALAGVAAMAIRYRLGTKHIAAIGLAVLAFMLLITPLSKGVSSGDTATQRLYSTVERVTDGNGENNAQIVALLTAGTLDPAHGGLFVERLRAMVPGASSEDPFALRVTRLAYGAGTQTTGYSTPTQYGLSYADGGPLGVLLGYAFSGALLAFAWRAVARLRSPLGAAIAVEGAIILGYMSVTGIHGVLATVPIASLALFIASGPHVWRSVLTAPSSRPTRDRQQV